MAAGNRAVTGKYVGMDSAWLSSYRTTLESQRDAALKAMQSYTILGKSMNRVDFNAIAAELTEVLYAQQIADGTRVTRTLADMQT